MKKYNFLLIVALFIVVSAKAQLRQGTIVTGIGTGQNSLFLLLITDGYGAAPNVLGFNMINNHSNHFVVVNVAPELGYALTKNFVAGTGLGWLYAKSKDFKYRNLSINPYIKGYFPIGLSRVQLLTQVSTGWGHTLSKDMETDISTIQYNAGIGTAIFLNRAVSFNAMIQFNAANSRDKGKKFESENRVDQLGINLGVLLYLGHRKEG